MNIACDTPHVRKPRSYTVKVMLTYYKLAKNTLNTKI